MASPPTNLFSKTDYDPNQDRENVRTLVASSFMALFGVIVLGYLGAAMFMTLDADRWSHLKEVMAVVLPAVTGTLGTALGFTSGSQCKN